MRHFSVCLFCGSRLGTQQSFAAEARQLGELLAARGHRLVYGAGDRGLMGEAARAAQARGGRITGVIPEHLVAAEVGKSDIDEYLVTRNMHERKMAMFERSDAAVALPGGPGTLDELIEVLTWRQLGLHDRPFVLINVDGYWDPLVTLLDHVIAHEFADPTFREFLTVVPSAAAAVDVLETLLNGRQNVGGGRDAPAGIDADLG